MSQKTYMLLINRTHVVAALTHGRFQIAGLEQKLDDAIRRQSTPKIRVQLRAVEVGFVLGVLLNAEAKIGRKPWEGVRDAWNEAQEFEKNK